MSYDFSAVTTAISNLVGALKQPLIDIGLAIVGVFVVIILIKYGKNWLAKLGGR